MLTKDVIETLPDIIVRHGASSIYIQALKDQAILAIDLTAENERLKTTNRELVCIRERNRDTQATLAAAQKKLDGIRGLIVTCLPDCGFRNSIMAILDAKESEEAK